MAALGDKYASSRHALSVPAPARLFAFVSSRVRGKTPSQERSCCHLNEGLVLSSESAEDGWSLNSNADLPLRTSV